mmetsp:Transcript_4796/g.10201  ORF Transcript_4796/g.10201 Transcript_4796/m.10201 type:complete len:211 (-) Transcript_4796:1367-1999(-)
MSTTLAFIFSIDFSNLSISFFACRIALRSWFLLARSSLYVDFFSPGASFEPPPTPIPSPSISINVEAYSDRVPTKSFTSPFPSKMKRWSATLSANDLSCETTIKTPLNSCKNCSRAVNVSRSQSVLGSSITKKLGRIVRTCNICNLRRSPPDKTETRSFHLCLGNSNLRKSFLASSGAWAAIARPSSRLCTDSKTNCSTVCSGSSIVIPF